MFLFARVLLLALWVMPPGNGLPGGWVVHRVVVALDRDEIHEIEDLPEVDHESFLALPDEHPSRRAAPWNGDVIDVLRGIGRVAGIRAESLPADIVHRAREGGAAVGRIGDGRGGAGPRRTGDQGERVGLVKIEVGRARSTDGTHILEGNGDALRAAGRSHVDRESGVVIGERVRELKLEGQIFHRVAGVVDLDLIEAGLVQRKVIRAAVGVLKWNVVGENGDIPRPAGLVTVE